MVEVDSQQELVSLPKETQNIIRMALSKIRDFDINTGDLDIFQREIKQLRSNLTYLMIRESSPEQKKIIQRQLAEIAGKTSEIIGGSGRSIPIGQVKNVDREVIVGADRNPLELTDEFKQSLREDVRQTIIRLNVALVGLNRKIKRTIQIQGEQVDSRAVATQFITQDIMPILDALQSQAAFLSEKQKRYIDQIDEYVTQVCQQIVAQFQARGAVKSQTAVDTNPSTTIAALPPRETNSLTLNQATISTGTDNSRNLGSTNVGIQEPQNRLEATDMDSVRKQINKLWDQIASSEASSTKRDVVYNAINNPYIPGKSIREAGILALAEEFLPEVEQNRWKTMVQIHNAFWLALEKSGSNQDPFKQIYYQLALESRAGAAGAIDFPKLREFAELAEVKPLINKVKLYFEGNTGNGVYRYENKGRQYAYNFGQNGNPSAEETENGYLTIAELLEKDFPNTESSIKKAVMYWTVLTEARMHYYTKYYANYTKTADGTFDTGVIALHSPMAALLYKIRGYGVIRPDLQLLWQVLRMPKKGGINQVNTHGKIKVDRDKELGRKAVHLGSAKGTIRITSESLDEYLPVASEDKSNPNGAVANNQVLETIEVRNLIDMGWTLYDNRFQGVQVLEDLVTIPTIWQIINDKTGQYKPISFPEYNKSIIAWKEFVEVIQHPSPINRLGDVDDRISTLVGKIAPFKAFLYMMPRETARGEIFRLMLQQMLLRATKRLYDDFNKAVNYPLKDRFGRPLTKKQYFLEFAIKEYTKLNTSDPDLSLFMINELKKEMLPNLSGTVFTGLFDKTERNIASFIYARFDGPRRERLMTSYQKNEPPDAKGK